MSFARRLLTDFGSALAKPDASDLSTSGIPPNLDRPLLIWDGACGFCERWVARWAVQTQGKVDFRPYQEVANRFPHIAVEAFENAVHLVSPSGEIVRGAEAVFGVLRYAHRPWQWLYNKLPPFAALSEAVYRTVAKHRSLFSRATRLLYGAHVQPPEFQIARWTFLRLLGLVYAIAFASMGVQIVGLVGEQGILPAQRLLEYYASNANFWDLPSIFWLTSSDAALETTCWLGVLISILLIFDVAPAISCGALWILYLSVCNVGSVFTGYQWDALLLEAGFLSIGIAPWRIAPRTPPADRRPGSAWRLLLIWLLFRLMFASGVVKLVSGDATWRDLTAMTYHYWTQPIPSWSSYYAAKLPTVIHQVSAVGMFACELLVPFLVFMPRRLRHFSAYALILLQLTILSTGNYGFFNLLTIALCVLLFDDRKWPTFLKRHLLLRNTSTAALRRIKPLRILSGCVFATLLILSSLAFARSLGWRSAGGKSLAKLQEAISPFRSVNGYGLFATMTTRRPEIIVEGSADGEHWLPYTFRYKVGDIFQAPPMIPFHMPRLDWQMWFAALGHWRSNRNGWFLAFLKRLKHANAPVLALLADDPFGGKTPRFLRSSLFDYRFSAYDEKETSGAWWTRVPLGQYAPYLTPEGFRRTIEYADVPQTNSLR